MFCPFEPSMVKVRQLLPPDLSLPFEACAGTPSGHVGYWIPCQLWILSTMFLCVPISYTAQKEVNEPFTRLTGLTYGT